MASSELLEVELRLKDFISKNMDTINDNIDKFGKRADQSNVKASKLDETMRRMGKTLIGLFAFQKVKQFVFAAANEFLKLERRMAEINTIARLNVQELKDVTNALEEMSFRVPKSADELGAGFYQILSAGIKDTADALEILEVSTRLAVGGVAEVGPTVKLVTGIINAYGLAVSDAERISDILFKTVENGVTTIPELASVLGRVIPIAKSAGIGIETLTASVATLTSRGLDTAESVTALSGALNAIFAPTDVARKELKSLGIVLKDDFLETIQQFKGLDLETIRKLIPEKRAAVAVLTLANNYKTLGRNIDDAAEAGGAALDAFDEQMKTNAATFELFKNKGKSALRSIGAVVVGVTAASLRAIETSFTAMFDQFKRSEFEAEEIEQAMEKRLKAAAKAREDFEARVRKSREGKTTDEKVIVLSDEEKEQILQAQRDLEDSRLLLIEDANQREFAQLQLRRARALKEAEDLPAAIKAINETFANEERALQMEQDAQMLERIEKHNDLVVRAEEKRNATIARERAKNVSDMRKQFAIQANLAASLGAAIGIGLQAGEGKGRAALKSMLNTLISFMEAKLLIGITSAGIETLLGNPLALFKIAGITALAGAARAGVASFQGGTSFAGGPAIVGEQGRELVNLPPGSSVINNTETNRILNSSPSVNIGTLIINAENPEDFEEKVNDTIGSLIRSGQFDDNKNDLGIS